MNGAIKAKAYWLYQNRVIRPLKDVIWPLLIHEFPMFQKGPDI